MNQEFRLTKIDEIRNYLIEEIYQNVKSIKVKSTKRFVEFWTMLSTHLYFNFYNNWMCFHLCFPFFSHNLIGITSSVIGLKICVISAEVKKYKWIIKKKVDEIELLAKSNLNSIEFWSSKALIVSNVSNYKLVLIDNVIKEFYNIKKEIKNSNDKWTIDKTMLPYYLKRKNILKVKIQT